MAHQEGAMTAHPIADPSQPPHPTISRTPGDKGLSDLLVAAIGVETHLLKQAIKLLERIKIERDPTLAFLSSKLQTDLRSKVERKPLFQINHVC